MVAEYSTTLASTIKNPQTFNRYSYGLNSPYKFTDRSAFSPNSQPVPAEKDVRILTAAAEAGSERPTACRAIGSENSMSTKLLKSIFLDPVSLTIGVIDVLCLIILYLWTSNRTISPENFYYQPLLLKLFVLLNIVPILITGLVFSPFFEERVSTYSYLLLAFYYILLILLSIIQWLIIGKIFSTLWAIVTAKKANK